MLDPVGRREVLEAVRELNEKEGITILWITHYMDEAAQADRILVMNEGKLVMEGTPREVFAQADQLKSWHLDVPQVTELASELRKRGMNIPADVINVKEFVEAAARCFVVAE